MCSMECLTALISKMIWAISLLMLLIVNRFHYGLFHINFIVFSYCQSFVFNYCQSLSPWVIFIINFIVHNLTQKIIVRAYKGNYHKLSRCPIRKTLLSSCETSIISLGLRLFYMIEFLVGICFDKAFVMY